jgi:hypothetical protein
MQVLQFDVQAHGVAADVAVVELTENRLTAGQPAAQRVPASIVIGVDRSGAVPVVNTADFDLLLTAATTAPHTWISVAADGMDKEIARISDAVTRIGLPAVVLAQVLRITRELARTDALLVESFAYSTLLGGQSFRNWLRARGARKQSLSGSRVRCEREADVLAIFMANPSRRNALDARMRDELVEALAAASDDPTAPTVQLRADGPDFCAGGDLAEFGVAGDLAQAHAIRSLRSPAMLLGAIASRATAYVHGACVGAGIEIPAAAGRVVAAADAQFWLPELAMGLIPGAGGTVTITRRIGRQRLLHWALGGQRINAVTARDWGLIDEVRGNL